MSRSEQLRIVFLTTRKADNYAAGSHFSMARALSRRVGQLTLLQYPRPVSRFSLVGWRKKLSQQNSRALGTSGILKSSQEAGARIGEQLESFDYDALVAPMASHQIAFLDIPKPIIYISDATARLMYRYYDPDEILPDQMLAEREEIARRANDIASAIILGNEWAADSTINDYGMPANKVYVVPSGPNLLMIPARDKLVKEYSKNVIRLLMVGRFWDRKGGDIGIEAVTALLNSGQKAHLSICGMTPPQPYDKSHVTVYSYLDKNLRRDYKKLLSLYVASHFLLYPSRAECNGLAMAEANALLTPVLASSTGGLPTYIKSGVNGFLFPPEARGQSYADKILETMSSPSRHAELCGTSRDEFERRLNWDTWARTVLGIIESVLH